MSGATGTNWSPVDSRVAVTNFGPAANTGVVDVQGNVNYSLLGSQTSSNKAVGAGATGVSKDCRVKVPVNSRVNPDNAGVEV